VVTGRALRYSSLVNTLCHELAHLRHFHHGPEFSDFYKRLLSWAREQGIYRPRGSNEAPGATEEGPLAGEELRAVFETLRSLVGAGGGAPERAKGAGPVQLSLFGDEA
jgi:hypothetical protein